MFKKYIVSLALIGCALINVCFAFEREVAITIDDLPFVGSASSNFGKLRNEQDRFLRIMQALVDNNVPATGFVIAGSIGKGQWEVLELFQQAGFTLGNHTFTHINLNTTSAERFIANVERADRVLTPLMTGTKYFRFPYLAEGRGDKRRRIQRFLADNNYVIAPVTIDSRDFIFNKQLLAIPMGLREQKLIKLKERYLDCIWRQTLMAERMAKRNKRGPTKQILLIHANLLNSLVMNDIIELFRQNGFRFITLAEALEPANSLRPNNRLQPINGLQPNNGLQPTNGLQPNNNGLQPMRNGLQPISMKLSDPLKQTKLNPTAFFLHSSAVNVLNEDFETIAKDANQGQLLFM